MSLLSRWRLFRSYGNGPLQSLRKAIRCGSGKGAHLHPKHPI